MEQERQDGEMDRKEGNGMEGNLPVNPNENCLEGMACPACGSFGPFRISCRISVTVSDDGTEDDGEGYEWSGVDPVTCKACGHWGTVDGFTSTDAFTDGAAVPSAQSGNSGGTR